MYTTKYEKYTKWHGALTTGMHIYATLNVLREYHSVQAFQLFTW